MCVHVIIILLLLLFVMPGTQLVERTGLPKSIRIHALDTLYSLMGVIDASPYLGTVLHTLLHACHSEVHSFGGSAAADADADATVVQVGFC
jgi:hypothetical protein